MRLGMKEEELVNKAYEHYVGRFLACIAKWTATTNTNDPQKLKNAIQYSHLSENSNCLTSNSYTSARAEKIDQVKITQ